MYVHWSVLEPVLAGLSAWRRRGRVWSGPCPVIHDGKDCCFLHQGLGDSVRGGCRRCHPVGPTGFREHLRAVLDAGGVADPAPAPSRLTCSLPSSLVDAPQRVRAVWDAAGRLEGTVAERYLLVARGCVGLGPWPAAMRYLPFSDVLDLKLRPRPPLGAAGVLVYGFRAPGEPDYPGVQLEAISPQGVRLEFRRAHASRVSLAGCSFRGGRRFDVRRGDGERLLLVEGPVSALAVLLRYPALDERWGVAGVAGWAGFTPAAVGSATRVVLCADGDPDGRRAVGRLADLLRADGRSVWVLHAPDGRDVADLWVRAGASPWRPEGDV